MLELEITLSLMQKIYDRENWLLKIFFNYIQYMKQPLVFSFPEILLKIINPHGVDQVEDQPRARGAQGMP